MVGGTKEENMRRGRSSFPVMTEYNDARYLQLLDQLQTIVIELIDMEGNDEELVKIEIDHILEAIKEG